MRVLNLYAGIGGNRKLWGDDIEVTAVELDPNIAKVYQDFYPKDTVIVGDAQKYLLENYMNFDFIWASPPCPTHSRARFPRVGVEYPNGNKYDAVYPDMSLYQIILLLDNYFKGFWIVENVIPFYTPLIAPSVNIGRHYYWSNYDIPKIEIEDNRIHGDILRSSTMYGCDLNGYGSIGDKRMMLRNMVNPQVGLYLFECAKMALDSSLKPAHYVLNLLDYMEDEAVCSL